MGQTIQLKDHAFNTPLYPITKAENVKLNDERDLVDEIESINGKIESIIQGESELEKYATTEYVDNNLANKADVGHIHQMQDIEGIEELEAQFDNMFEEYTQEQISVDFPNASTISIVDNDDLFTSTTIEGALRELANNSGSGNAEGIKFDNSSNEMTSVNVQDAIEENKTSILNIENELSKSENTSYATENGIKEFSCKNGYVDNVVIEGETLVNLFSFNTTRTNFDGSIIRTYAKNDSRIINGTYTLYNFNDKVIHYTKSKLSDGTYLGSVDLASNSCTKVELGEDERIYGCDFWTQEGWEGVTSNYTDATMKLLVLEGDHTNKPISYFEGLKSVGQGDKIEVLSYNDDNIFTTIGVTKGKYLNTDGKTEVEDSIYGYTDYIQIDNVEYNSNFRHGVNVYDANKQFIEYVVMDGYIPRITNAKYIRVNVTLNEMNKYIITKGKIDKKQILTTLRSLPNGVKDTIEKRGNKYYKIKRCGEVVLNENLAWFKVGSVSKPNTIQFGIKKDSNVAYKGDSEIYYNCDKFSPTEERNWNDDKEFIFINPNDYIVSILKTKLTAQTLEGFKTWLKSNPVTVVYELATPMIEELPNFNPQTFEGNTTFLLNSGAVQGEADFEVTNSMGSELEVLKGKVSNLDDYVVDEEIYYPNLLNGWQETDGMCKVVRYGKIVTINMRIRNGVFTNGTTLFTLPSNLSPSKLVVTTMLDNNLNLNGGCAISEEGNVHILQAKSAYLAFSVSYTLN